MTPIHTAARAIATTHGVDPDEVTQLPGGVANHAFRLGSHLILRIPRSAAFIADLQKELAVIPVARAAGVRTPAIVAQGTIPLDNIPTPYVVMDRIHGHDLVTHPDALTAHPGANLWSDLGREIALLHQVRQPQGRPILDHDLEPSRTGGLDPERLPSKAQPSSPNDASTGNRRPVAELPGSGDISASDLAGVTEGRLSVDAFAEAPSSTPENARREGISARDLVSAAEGSGVVDAFAEDLRSIPEDAGRAGDLGSAHEVPGPGGDNLGKGPEGTGAGRATSLEQDDVPADRGTRPASTHALDGIPEDSGTGRGSADELVEQGYLDAETGRWVGGWMDGLRERFDENSPKVLLHGDLAPQNLMVDDSGRLVAVIDWGDAAWGPRGMEFAKLRLGDVVRVLPAYKDAADVRFGRGELEAAVLWFHLQWGLSNLTGLPRLGERHWTAPPASRVLGVLRFLASDPPEPWRSVIKKVDLWV
jgi:aminoglycoside phosphotransferase